jgi:hypothetical protein
MWMRVKRKLRRQFGTSRHCFRHTFPNFDGGMMTSSIHLCVASLTYMLYNFSGGFKGGLWGLQFDFVVTIVIVQMCLAFKKGLSRSLDLD